ncbi:hypothetical protein ACWCXH_38030 [Kitasatospora sp. NPDC001660]
MFVDGPWRITVVGKDADFDQRAVVRTPYGTLVLAGLVGESLVVNADTWELSLEHLWPGRGWRPDVQVVPGPVTTTAGRRSREVRATDCHWPGHPRPGVPRNLVLRLDALGSEPEDGRTTAEAIGPAPAPLIRTSSGPVPGVPGDRPDDRPDDPGLPADDEALAERPGHRDGHGSRRRPADGGPGAGSADAHALHGDGHHDRHQHGGGRSPGGHRRRGHPQRPAPGVHRWR